MITQNTAPTFAVGDGIVTTQVGSNSRAHDITVQSDGKILVAGFTNISGHNVDVIIRYNSNGSLDTTFDGDGIVTTQVGSGSGAIGVTMQADGKILVAGFTKTSNTSVDSAFALTRYNSNGSLDSTFSGNGIVTTKVGLGSYASGVTVQSDGKILVAGDSETIFGDMQFTLIRYNSNGNLDAAVPNSFPTGTVTITGTSTQGQTLTASNSLADADGLGAISYQWLNNGNVIPGATQPTYTLTSADAGKTISVKASYTDLQGTSENVSSESTTVVISTKPSKGNDLLTGTVNNDKISALAGNDTLRGGLGSDKLAGGKGADTFTFTSIENSGITSKTRDTITDFKHSEGDQIDLAGLGFTEFIGTQAFRTTNATGQLRFDAKAHILYGSTNADNQPEFSTLLSGVKILVADDFVL
ncbi:hypothetical protein LBMAG43_19590 [Methylococcaceae bacterium]|nr:hypothetical protein LBMAG43_19590 [Methylococcaceae bacterium]